MQDNENLSETESTAADEMPGDGSESTVPEQHQDADLHHNMKDEPHGDETASTEFVEEDEDDGPVELDDPFSGSENAKPVIRFLPIL